MGITISIDVVFRYVILSYEQNTILNNFITYKHNSIKTKILEKFFVFYFDSLYIKRKQLNQKKLMTFTIKYTNFIVTN